MTNQAIYKYKTEDETSVSYLNRMIITQLKGMKMSFNIYSQQTKKKDKKYWYEKYLQDEKELKLYLHELTGNIE